MTISQIEGSYRQRIYDSYVNARRKPLAPLTVAGLKPRMPYLRKLINRHFPADKNSSVLELGCGHGALLYVLSHNGYKQLRGVDSSPEQVGSAQLLGIQGVEQGDLMKTLKDTAVCSLDVVVTFDVIEHFTKQELIFLIDEVWRVLKRGGRWIIHVPNAESPFGARMQYWDFTHELAFTSTSLSQLMIASGFKSVDCFEDRPVPHGFISLLRRCLWSLIRAGLLIYIAAETGDFDRRAIFSQNLLAVAYR